MLKALFYPDVPFTSLCIPHIYKEIYFDNVYADIFNQNHEMVIIDIGANIGIVTGFMREYARKVYAVEPAADHFEALKMNKEFNKWDNVEIFNMAIADSNGQMKLNRYQENRTMHSLTTDYSQGAEIVVTVAMDTFFTKNKIEHVDFMKFDVEGAEDMILRSQGFKKVAERIQAIEVEFHGPGGIELIHYMKELGYRAKRMISDAMLVLFTRPNPGRE